MPLGTYSGAHQSESDFETKALGKPIFVVSAAFEQNDLSFVATDLKTNLKSTLFTVDTMFKYRGFSATGAYTWGEREPQEVNAKFDTSGWFAQAGFFLKPEKWEIAARYGEQDPSDARRPGQDHRDPGRAQLLLRPARAQGAGRLRPDQDRDLERSETTSSTDTDELSGIQTPVHVPGPGSR